MRLGPRQGLVAEVLAMSARRIPTMRAILGSSQPFHARPPEHRNLTRACSVAAGTARKRRPHLPRENPRLARRLYGVPPRPTSPRARDRPSPVPQTEWHRALSGLAGELEMPAVGRADLLSAARQTCPTVSSRAAEHSGKAQSRLHNVTLLDPARLLATLRELDQSLFGGALERLRVTSPCQGAGAGDAQAYT